jgi:hypothetical protein
MKLRYKILVRVAIGLAVAVVLALAVHFGGPWLVDAIIALHS